MVPRFKEVYEGDDILCFQSDKMLAVIGYYSLLPSAIKHVVRIDYNEYGIVSFYNSENNKVISVYMNSYGYILIGELFKMRNRDGSYSFLGCSYISTKYYCRQTIDNIILNTSPIIEKELGIEEGSLVRLNLPHNFSITEEINEKLKSTYEGRDS